MGEVKHFTLEEREKIEEGIKREMTIPQIALLINRSPHSVRNEIRVRAEKREDYDAHKAHKEFLSAGKRRRKTLMAWIERNQKPKMTDNQVKYRQRKFCERLDILEQKLELLTQIIKRKQNANLLD